MRAHLMLLPCLGIAMPAAAQSQPTSPGPPSGAPLEARIKALEADLEDVKDQNTDLKAELDDLKARIAANKPPTSLSALNPQITAFINGAMRVDDHPVLTPKGVAIDDRPFLRTAELDLRAAVDPYADAVTILSLENQAGEGFGVDAEEAYVVVKRLPVLESAPLGLKLKLGRFRAPIGSGNRIHMHDLPWTTRPLPIARMLGTENGEFFESGFNPVGAEAEVILPTVIPGVVQELTADVVDGGDIAIADGLHDHPGFIGHYNLFFTVHDAHDFNFGASGYYQGGAQRAGLWAVDALYKWKPLAAGEFHSVVIGGELFGADRRFQVVTPGGPPVLQRATPLAGYGFAQLQLDWHTYVGARYDYAQDITNPHLATQVAAGYLSYYTSEFLRFRAGYEHRWSDVAADNGINSFIAEVNVVFGSHPTEPYWVNR